MFHAMFPINNHNDVISEAITLKTRLTRPQVASDLCAAEQSLQAMKDNWAVKWSKALLKTQGKSY